MGGPITGVVDAARATKRGESARNVVKSFGKSLRPGQGVEAMHDAHVGVAEEIARQTTNDKIASRIRTFGRATKPTTPLPTPGTALEATGSAIAAAGAGDWRRAGRTFAGAAGAAAMGPLVDPMNKGQAVGDLFDEPSAPLDSSLFPYLRRIFGESLDVELLEINPGRPGSGSAPFATTFPNVLYLGGKGQQALDPITGNPLSVNLSPEGMVTKPGSVLVHELVHIWQAQHLGHQYLIEAVGGYAAHGRDESYDWWNFTDYRHESRVDSNPLTHGAEWRDLPIEPQAEFIQNAFDSGSFEVADYPGYGGLALSSVDIFNLISGGQRAANSYEAAFGVGTIIDWSFFLANAVRALHEGDYRR